MEADVRYYWRRAVEEQAACRRSVTPQARERHRHFARLYLDRLQDMGGPLPFSHADLEPVSDACQSEAA